ncbi:MAG: IPT/TIG domain-containing protein, partial [Gammaproteobacteria bacterium]|nr:IPT/TIG domain-containing protein [Gammaproteobacteria bacterium]
MSHLYPSKYTPLRILLISAFTLSLSACGGGGGGSGSDDNPVPAVSSISPSEMRAASSDFIITVSGSNFADGAEVHWNGSPRPTAAGVSGSGNATTSGVTNELTVTISGTDIALPGTAEITVVNPAPGGGASAGMAFSITNPLPVGGGLSADTAIVAGPDFTVTVTGSQFFAESVVRWNGDDRDTTFVSATELQATITAADIAATGSAQITVFNPVPGGGTSDPLSFTVINPPPSIVELLPSLVPSGGPDFTLILNGTNFVVDSVVRWNGADRLTTMTLAGTQLSASIAAGDIASQGTANVEVFNPEPGGGLSAAMTIMIDDTAPTTTGISPNSAVINSGSINPLVVSGTNFNANSIVEWNGVAVPTFLVAGELNAQIDSSLLTQAGTAFVNVFRPPPGGGDSNAQMFTINNPQPTINGFAPPVALVGTGNFTVNVNGTGFVQGAQVLWNNTPRPTTFISGGTLTADIMGTDIAVAGSANITVRNPDPAVADSAVAVYDIENPFPAVNADGLSPNNRVAGTAGAFTLTVNGTNFVNGASINWNGVPQTTTVVNATQLTASIDAANVGTAGVVPITATNPGPGGGTSTPARNFTVNNPQPVINNLMPTVAVVPNAFMLTVNGSAFIDGAEVLWNGAARPTTFVNGGQLTADIPATDVAMTGSASIAVRNPAPAVADSAAVTLPIENPVPAIDPNGLNPDNRLAGTPGNFLLTVNGTNFLPTSVINWNGVPQGTNFVSGNQITTTIAAANTSFAGNIPVTVTNPAPGGGISASRNFAINNPQPAITGFNPAAAIVGTGDFTLTENSSNFVQGAAVLWGGTPRATTFVSSGILRATILAADIAVLGDGNVSVRNPPPAVADSAVVQLPINNPTPALTDIEPRFVALNGGVVPMTITGTGFTVDSEVRVNGLPLITGFVNGTTLTANVPANITNFAGTAAITAINPGPGGGLSNPETFFVLSAGQEFFYDGFARQNGPIGNSWTEKMAGQESWAIINNALQAPGGFFTYHDKVVYRPMNEDRRDVELSMEFIRQPAAIPDGEGGFPQIHARIQRDTVQQEATLQSYIFYVEDGNGVPGRASLAVNAPVPEELDCNLVAIPFPRALEVGNRYRLRLNISGTGTVLDPVVMIGSVDELDATGNWVLFATGIATHDPTTPINPALF